MENNLLAITLENFNPTILKKINLENLTYWNVEDQEAYFSYIEAESKREKK